MRTHEQSFRNLLLRCLLISGLLVSGATMIAEFGPAAFTSHAAPTAVESVVERQAPAINASAAVYRWNLNDNAMPLISLPDRIGGGVDQHLTYSMDRYEFPLFQSLYYNKRAGKYLLMVIPKEDSGAQTVKANGEADRRSEFIELAPTGAAGQFAANGKLSLRLEDRGGVKVLSTKDGTLYTFAAFADGELHCSRINDRHGVVINFKYTSDASIETISDDRGRTITFSYTNAYVSSIAQTWGGSARKLKQTWAIADDYVRFAHAPAARAAVAAPGAAATAKHIPSNAIRPNYTREMAASDSMLAKLFGGSGAVAAANGFEPTGLGHQYPLYRGDLIGDDGRILRGHLSFAMHLYGSADGTAEMSVYIPVGFTTHSDEPSPTDAAITFYYPRLGNLTDVTLAVFHVKDFQLSYEGGRVRIGNIGGPGGSIGSYRHSHLEFYHGNTGLPALAARVQLRIDPATVFASAALSRN
jgi:hypothetical protein